MFTVTVDPDKCIGDDEECVEVCPVDVYKIQDGKAVPVNADECLGCESCLDACEYEAITISED
jgi:NAD-dependent dihydropyrimidine dehydrogenase PreA subunit